LSSIGKREKKSIPAGRREGVVGGGGVSVDESMDISRPGEERG
jgi:hypothetical protein